MFSKNFFSVFIIFSFVMFLNLSLMNFYQFSFSYSNFFCLENFLFSFKIDLVSIYFYLMVSFVTCLVFIFSEIYMEFYSNMIFNVYTIFFFSCMMFLSLASSPMCLMLGWEYLGISSIFLVMFYSNKTTFFNSILTMYFNRLGDVLLIISLGLMLNESFFLSFFYKEFSVLILILLLICSFTKSAQFPFSSWLPAAMSAPTPISAMVHSSTLVTAGVLIVLNTRPVLNSFNFIFIICFFNLLSFFCGGLLANLELDLKKLVAFSTLSQVSLIYFFAVYLNKEVSFCHMIFHALFKSSLFCFCGVSFMMFFSDQNYLKLESTKNILIFCGFIFSLFSMTGLAFSSSFFSKDLVLEFLFSDYYFFFLCMLFMGGSLTVLYSAKILTSITSKGVSFCSSYKMFLSFFFLVFISIMLLAPLQLKVFDLSSSWMLEKFDVMFFNLFFFSLIFVKISNMNSFFYEVSLDIMFMKTYAFNWLNTIFKNYSSFFFKDDFIYFNLPNLKFYLYNLNFSKLLFFFIFLSLI